MEGPQPDRPPPAGGPEQEGPPTRRARLGAFWARHRRLFWMVHSAWALATGVAVVVLARERYGLVPWIVLFLGLTWVSSLFFGDDGSEDGVPSVGRELTSYATRTLYQETLFFLLPFYAYSTVIRSPNVLFTLLLAGLAIVSCIDLLFDRWLRTKPVFGFFFFGLVAFAALNLLLPMLVGMDPSTATLIASVAAVGSALPLATRGASWSRRKPWGLTAGVVVLLVITLAWPAAIPPVPLRVEDSTFASDINDATLELSGLLDDQASLAELGGRLVLMAEVFAPANVPTRVRVRWLRDGNEVRLSRWIDITAHEASFRVWDGLRADLGNLGPGRHRVTLETRSGSVFGVADFVVTGD